MLRLDQEFEKSIGSEKKFTKIKPKDFLISKDEKPLIKPEIKLSTLIALGNTPEIVKINNMIVKKRLLEVTTDFLEPFYLFFEKQYNVFLLGLEDF